MSVDLDHLADEHLDDLLDRDAWEAIVHAHGDAATAALDRARARRDAVATMPRPTPPADLAAAIQARTTGPTPSRADVDRDGPTVIHPHWNWFLVAGPLLTAAALALALWPLWHDEPVTGGDGDDRLAHHDTPRTEVPTRDRRAAPAIAPEDDAGATEPGLELALDAPTPTEDADARAFDHDERGPSPRRSDAHTAARAAPEAGAAPAPGPRADTEAEADTAASAPAPATPPIDTEAEATADAIARADTAVEAIDDQALRALTEEAERFRAAQDDEPRIAVATQLPAAVSAEAQTVERQRRAQSGLAADEASAPPPVAVAVEMTLEPAEDADGAPALAITLSNRSARRIEHLAGILTLEGLGDDDTVIWSRPLPGPADTRIDPGDGHRWRVPLDGDLLPPAAVTALRLRSGDTGGPSLPLR